MFTPTLYMTGQYIVVQKSDTDKSRVWSRTRVECGLGQELSVV